MAEGNDVDPNVEKLEARDHEPNQTVYTSNAIQGQNESMRPKNDDNDASQNH